MRGENRKGKEWIRYPDRTICVRRYPPGISFEQTLDMEPLLEVWRDPEGNVIERPDPKLYPGIPSPETVETLLEYDREHPISEEQRREQERRGREWVRSAEGKEHRKRQAETERRKLGLSPEEFQRYNEAMREYEDKLWEPGPARRPQPEYFRGTAP